MARAPFSVARALDSYVESQSSVRLPDGKWHPSSMFGCDRKAIYEVRGVEKSDLRDERSHRVLFVGSRWHEIVQEAVALHGEVDEVFTEVPIDLPNFNIVGHADQLVRLGRKYELEEYKSISSRGFSFLKGAPKPEHVDQAKVYMFALRTVGAACAIEPQHTDPEEHDGFCGPVFPLGDALDRMRFVYISKDDLQIEEFVVKWDPTWEQEIKEVVARLDAYRADEDSLPLRLPMSGKKKNWLCGYCEFRTRCWTVDDEGIVMAPAA